MRNKSDLNTREQELYNLLISTPKELLPSELAERMDQIDTYIGQNNSQAAQIARAEFRQDAVARWIIASDDISIVIEWPTLG